MFFSRPVFNGIPDAFLVALSLGCKEAGRCTVDESQGGPEGQIATALQASLQPQARHGGSLGKDAMHVRVRGIVEQW